MANSLDILLVDNEIEFLESIAFWLETREHRVRSCYKGREAVELIRKTPPDIVFLDIRMPDLDGIEALREVRLFNKNIPIIIVTSYPQEEKMEEAIGLGASGFFPKTGSFEELSHLLKTVIRTHKDLHLE